MGIFLQCNPPFKTLRTGLYSIQTNNHHHPYIDSTVGGLMHNMLGPPHTLMNRWKHRYSISMVEAMHVAKPKQTITIATFS